jgi:hypothetical protein
MERDFNIHNWQAKFLLKENTEDFTVGKLIAELRKHDQNLPVRVGCMGYTNQEIVQIIEKGEYDNETDESIKILQLNGNGSYDEIYDENEDDN